MTIELCAVDGGVMVELYDTLADVKYFFMPFTKFEFDTLSTIDTPWDAVKSFNRFKRHAELAR